MRQMSDCSRKAIESKYQVIFLPLKKSVSMWYKSSVTVRMLIKSKIITGISAEDHWEVS